MEAQGSTDLRQRAGRRRRSCRAPLAVAALLALLVLCGLFAAAAPAPADASVSTPFFVTSSKPVTITVTAPTGSTTYAQGSDLTVAWTSTAAGEFGLWARSGSGGWYAATLISASAGSTSTRLTLNVPPGSGYQAIVAWRPTAGSGAWQSWGTSPGSFTVAAATADLTDLWLSGLVFGFGFAPATYTYTGVTTPNAFSSVTVTPTGAGVITVDGAVVASGSASAAIALTAGVAKTITVVATEAGKSAKTYTITVTRSTAPQATPTFSPAAGAVAPGTLVTITSAGADRIYYTTDGTTPNSSSPMYSAPLAVSPPMTLKALAVKAGYPDSAVGSAAYTQAAVTADLTGLVLSGSPANYVFAPATYAYVGVTVVHAFSSVTVTPTGAGTITVNGTTVASGSASAAIALTAGTAKTITVVATEAGKSAKTYTIRVTRSTVAPSRSAKKILAFSFASPSAGGVIDQALQTIAVTPPYGTNVSALVANFTTTGASVKVGSTKQRSGKTANDFTSPVTYKVTSVAHGQKLYVVTVTVNKAPQATPTFSPAAGAVASGTLVTITSAGAAPGTAIHYTTDGSAPTASSPVYSAPVAVSPPMTLKALAVKAGYDDSAVGSAAYTKPVQATPTFSPAAGAVASGTTVTIISAGADAIYYTTDGTTPTTSSTNQATTPLVITAGVTVKALAVKAGYANSLIGEAAYTALTLTVTAPTGSETYAQGSLLTVAWTTSESAPAGGEFSVWARVLGGNWYGGQLVAASGLAAYSTDLTLDMPPGDGYQAIVGWRPTAGSGEWATWGVSPGSFSVTSEPPPPPPPSPGVATKLTITRQPDGGASGALLRTQPIVRIEDAAGNLVSSTATINVYVRQGGGTLGGTTQLAAVGGVATFTDLTLAGTVLTDNTLHFYSGDLTGATSSAIQVTVGALHHFDFAFDASPHNCGAPFAGTNTLTAKDSGGNTLTAFNASANNVTITATGGTISGIHSGAVLNLVGDFTSGVANLTSLGMIFTGNSGSQTFTATSATSPAKTGTADLYISVGDLDHFDLLLASPQHSGAPFVGTNTLTAKDSGGNTLTAFDASADNVTISAISVSAYQDPGTISGLSGAGGVLAEDTDFQQGVATLADDERQGQNQLACTVYITGDYNFTASSGGHSSLPVTVKIE